MKYSLVSFILWLVLCGCTETKTLTLRTVAVEKLNLEKRITIAGEIRPNKELSIYPPYNGYVREIFVSVGQDVREGDQLVAISQSNVDSGPVYPIRSPFSGTVVQVVAKEGQYVRKSDQENLILRVDDLSSLFVKAHSPELEYNRIQTGQEVMIRVTAVGGRTYKGRVLDKFLAATRKSEFGRDAKVDFQVNVDILDEDDQIRPGMSVIIDILAQKKNDALALPHEFVEKRDEGYFVVTDKGDEVQVQLGIQTDLYSEVHGLKEGQLIRQVDFYQ